MTTNVVTLELTGDESSLETAIAKATQQVKNLSDTSDTTATAVGGHATRIESSFTDMSDKLATKSGTLAGAIGGIAGGMSLLGIGQDDLAGKILGGLGVAMGTFSGIMDIASIATGGNTLALIGSKIALGASTIATGAATAAQWLLNAAMSANPIGLIVLAIGVLIGVIVLIATKTTWFQDAWKAAWGGIKTAVGAVRDFFVDTVWHGGIEKAFDAIGTGVGVVVDWFKSIPGKIGSAFSGLIDVIKAPFRAAFNFISDAWNNTVGSLRFEIPSWVPGLGGKGWDVPDLPKWHGGGVVDGGPEGAEVVGVLRVGERVQTREMQAAESGGGVHIHGDIIVNGNKFRDGTDFEEWLNNLRNDGRGGGDVTE